MSNRKVVAMIAVLGGGIGMVLISSCAGLVYMGYKNARDEVSPRVDAMFSAIENGTFSQTYETETAQELRDATPREQYQDLGNALASQLGPLKSKSLRSFVTRHFNADTYMDVTYNATFERGEGTIIAQLKKEGEAWKFVRLHVQSPVFQQGNIQTSRP